MTLSINLLPAIYLTKNTPFSISSTGSSCLEKLLLRCSKKLARLGSLLAGRRYRIITIWQLIFSVAQKKRRVSRSATRGWEGSTDCLTL